MSSVSVEEEEDFLEVDRPVSGQNHYSFILFWLEKIL
jgi:hypothetical protein